MYLAANGKIYITSGSSVQHIHEMNYPDSAGFACDVQQHSIFLGGNYFHLRSIPNHPNYYLGPVTGSVCDSLSGIHELEHNFKFTVSPNPSKGQFRIMYLLPQNMNGKLEVFDISGKRVYELELPQWSTMQIINLPFKISSGIYNCVISSGENRKNAKLALLRE